MENRTLTGGRKSQEQHVSFGRRQTDMGEAPERENGSMSCWDTAPEAAVAQTQ